MGWKKVQLFWEWTSRVSERHKGRASFRGGGKKMETGEVWFTIGGGAGKEGRFLVQGFQRAGRKQNESSKGIKESNSLRKDPWSAVQGHRGR